MAEHLFRANWQNRQFSLVRSVSPFPAQSVCMVLDFAENFTCNYQQEVQAAHWHHEQVTVHPIVAYYRCPVCPKTVTESLIFVSSDRRHDYHAVHHFTKQALVHLRETRGLVITHVNQWTDGCSAQYKSKGPFADIACALTDYDATLERNFFGSRHGKGPSDGESAVVKRHAAAAVAAGRAIIATAEDLHEYYITSALNKQPSESHKEADKDHFFRTFFWVGDADIQRDRADRMVLTVPGTRTFHSVKCIEQNKILTRHLGCCCFPCHAGVGICINSGITGPWTDHNLRPVQDGRRRPPGVPQPRRPPAVPQPRRQNRRVRRHINPRLT